MAINSNDLLPSGSALEILEIIDGTFTDGQGSITVIPTDAMDLTNTVAIVTSFSGDAVDYSAGACFSTIANATSISVQRLGTTGNCFFKIMVIKITGAVSMQFREITQSNTSTTATITAVDEINNDVLLFSSYAMQSTARLSGVPTPVLTNSTTIDSQRPSGIVLSRLGVYIVEVPK